MIFGKIVGTVVSSQIDEGIKDKKTLLVRICDQMGREKDNFMVAVDLVGTGLGEMVMISQGSSARQTDETDRKPIDCVIVGIVDLVEENNKTIFRK